MSGIDQGLKDGPGDKKVFSLQIFHGVLDGQIKLFDRKIRSGVESDQSAAALDKFLDVFHSDLSDPSRIFRRNTSFWNTVDYRVCPQIWK